MINERGLSIVRDLIETFVSRESFVENVNKFSAQKKNSKLQITAMSCLQPSSFIPFSKELESLPKNTFLVFHPSRYSDEIIPR
jgi:hypothetical protein